MSSAAPLPDEPDEAPIPGPPSTAPLPGASTNNAVLPPMPFPSKIKKSILTKYRPTKPMRSLYWNVIPEKQLKDTIFEDIKINEDDIYLDFEALEELGQNKKVKKVKKNKDIESVNENKTEFVSDIIESVRSNRIRTVALVLFRYNGIKIDDVINEIVNNLQNIKDIEYLEKLAKIIPSQHDMDNFKNHPKILNLNNMDKKEDRHRIISKFPLIEQLWYFCMEIPSVHKRCQSHLFRLEMNEFISFHSENLKLTQNLYNTLKNNAKISKICALILEIGNFINYRHSTLGKVDGFTLDTFDKLKISRSNQDNRYSLLIYLVEMVNTNYPELSDWVNIFDPFESCQRIQFNWMVNDIMQKRRDMTYFVINITENKDDDEFYKDIYKWSVKMTSTINKLNTECDNMMNKIQTLQDHFGYIPVDNNNNNNVELFGFSRMLMNIQRDWNQSQQIYDRAKNIFIAFISGYIRDYEHQYDQHIIPAGVIWTIYVYFPKWNLLSISRYLDFSQYELNQYKSISNRLPVRLISAVIDLSMIRSSKQNKKMKPIPNKKMKLLQWNRIANINDTIFQNIKDNEKEFEVCIDFEMLEKLWCDTKRKKRMIVKNDSFAMFYKMDVNRLNAMKIIGSVLFKGHPKGLRDTILNIADITDIEYLRKIMRIIPKEEQMDTFKNSEKVLKSLKCKNVDNMISKWDFLEQLWYHCMDIPFLTIRCELKLLELDVDELEIFNYENIDLLQNIFNALYNNDEIKKIVELILFIGNYLNFGKRKISNCRGYPVIETLLKMMDFKSKSSEDYSLFMYLVETINQNYPELSHWIDAFDDAEKCLRIGFDQIRSDNLNIQTRINEFKLIMDEIESKDDDIDKMKNNIHDIVAKMDKTNNEFEQSVSKCGFLMDYFVYNEYEIIFDSRTVSRHFIPFCSLAVKMNTEWNSLQIKFDKIRDFIVAYCRKYGKTEKYSLDIMPNEVITRIYLYFPKLFEMKDLIKKYHGTIY